ncbi:hypothetical protein [Pedobacter sp. KBW06]|uniref:hypothetical protein n=1 Tax=Pedobacter sp. KBW06 TaxID=2153359 RepID=UPI000F594B3C|nr:hypothetical protein [Pedobacter sp. KBW06]
MLNLRNAKPLSRSDMKAAIGGIQTSSFACIHYCFENPGGPTGCGPGQDCVIYYCGPDHNENYGYECR